MTEDLDSSNSIGRRRFLKSIFGLGAIVEESVEAKPSRHVIPHAAPVFIWADLKNGNVGFPTGLNLGGGMPGSTMKLVAAAALHEEALISPNQIYECSGEITLHKETFHCQHAHGRVNLTHAIAKSCNVFFVQAAEKLHTTTFLTYARKFGFDLPVARQKNGTFPEAANGPSYRYVLGLAEDMQPNALQILRMSAIVATRGDVPFLHSAEDLHPGERFDLALSDGTWHRLQQGMELACTEGTAQKLDPENKLHIAAKTGTAPRGTKFTSWITGYFPIANPKHAFVLNTAAGTSQEAAVPQAHKFLFATTWPE
jgi:cell division protein FtsI/penicillin-binding protein 2